MKTYLSILILLINLSCKSQENTNVSKDSLKLQNQIELLKKQNDSLERKVEQLLSSKDAVVEVVDKIDNLYNNNFNRFIAFWGIVASLIILGIPYYITQIQKKIIETKKKEILNFSTTELKKLELKLYADLTKKYSELSDLITMSNEKSKENLEKETIKANVMSLYIASKVNELDKNYNKIFRNLADAILRSNSIEFFTGVNFHLNNFLKIYDKLEAANVELDKEKLKAINDEFESLRKTDEIDQDILEKILEKIK